MHRKVTGNFFLLFLVIVLFWAAKTYMDRTSPEAKAINAINSGEFDAAFEAMNNVTSYGSDGEPGSMRGVKLASAAIKSKGYVRYLLDKWVESDHRSLPKWAWWVVRSASIGEVVTLDQVENACERHSEIVKRTLDGPDLAIELRRINYLQDCCAATKGDNPAD